MRSVTGTDLCASSSSEDRSSGEGEREGAGIKVGACTAFGSSVSGTRVDCVRYSEVDRDTYCGRAFLLSMSACEMNEGAC
jgi:hypothetical protein